MAVGVAVPTVPVANDVILGEFKLYQNYGLPSELLLGSTRGGAKLSVDRKIKEIKFDGAYGNQLDSNGVPLVRVEEINTKLTVEQLYLKYFNKKTISDCESTSGMKSSNWAGTGGTFAAETTIVNSGTQSAKCSASTTLYGIHEVFSPVKDLTAFDNLEVSGTSDYISFALYITTAEKSDLGTSKIRVAIHKDVENTYTNYYYYDVAAADLTANVWTTFKILKSAFTQTGTASWSAVTGISFALFGAPSAAVDFYVDSVDLLQAQSRSSVVPVNAGGFDVSNQTTYYQLTQSLEITDDDYLDNVTLVGQRHDGKMMKFILKNCLNDGKIDLALQEKDEVVNSTEFTSHFLRTSPTTVPFIMREYV